MNFITLLSVAMGGAIGASARYTLGSVVGKYYTGVFPYATLIINILGALLIGGLVELMAVKWSVSQDMRAFLIVGILGGFTTFSAYSLEVVLLAERGEMMSAIFYALFSVAACVLAVLAGSQLIRWVA
jgi:CrcB protein